MGTGIIDGMAPLRFHKHPPARTEPFEQIVQMGGVGGEFPRGGRIEIRPPVSEGFLEGAVFVEDDARGH